MTGISTGSVGTVNLAGSLAGASRNSADADRLKEAAAERNLQTDLKGLAARSLDDIGEADETGDRDADGRAAWDFEPRQDASGEPASEEPKPRRAPRAPDADGDRGVHLDLEA